MCASVRCVRCTVCGSASGEVVLDTSALYGWLFDGGGERRGRLGRNGDRPVRLRLRGWPVCTRSWRRYRFCARAERLAALGAGSRAGVGGPQRPRRRLAAGRAGDVVGGIGLVGARRRVGAGGAGR